MTSAKHTEGPWDFCRLNNGRWGIYPESAVNDGIDYFIATTRQVADPAREKDYARLMAASPKVLEALKRARQDLWEALHSHMSEAAFNKEVEYIDAALNAAEGKQP
jgi:hypothetical protein